MKNKKLKILNIIQRYHPAKGGAEIFIKNISEYAHNLGYKVDVWTTDALDADTLWDLEGEKIEKKVEKINGVKVVRFPIGKGILSKKYPNKIFRVLLQNIPSFKISNLATCPTTFWMLDEVKRLKKGDYDLVLASTTPYFFLLYVGYLISKKLDIPYVIAPALHTGVESDDLLRKKYLRKTSIPFYQHASKIILNTKAEGEAIATFCKENGVEIDKEKFEIIGQGVFIDEVTSGDGVSFRKKYNLKYPIVFQVGSKNIEKGSFNLVDAMKNIWDKEASCHLVFGGQPNKEFADYIESLDDKYRKWIINIDNITDKEKWDLFASGDVFSMVSKTDSFGIVYLEAWSNGIPVLGCNNEAIKQVISNGKDGYLCDFDDIYGISEKIYVLLSDSTKRKIMGQNGKQKVKEKYDWNKNLKKIDKIYSDISG